MARANASSVKVKFDMKKHLKKKDLSSLEVTSLSLAERILQKAKDYCPVETGTLRDSGRIIKSKKGYTVVFTAPHALYVHEMPQSLLKNGYSQFLRRAVIEVINEG